MGQPFDSANQHWKEIRVYYEDTDFTGMVYHANYLRFFERGRSDMLRDAGISHSALLEREDPAAFTLTGVEVDYKRAARVDDLIQVRSRYMGLAGARMTFHQSAYRGETVLAEARIRAVMIHLDGRARRPLPDIADQLESYRFRGAED